MLFVVDMQNDFVDQKHGKMAVKNADKLVPDIIKKIQEYEKDQNLIFYTLNIHKNMPDDSRPLDERSWGGDLYQELEDILRPHHCVEKYNYGIPPHKSQEIFKGFDGKYMKKIEIVGVETHICVISNAIILQNIFPDSQIIIDENLCTSNDMVLHGKALDIMEELQMEVQRK